MKQHAMGVWMPRFARRVLGLLTLVAAAATPLQAQPVAEESDAFKRARIRLDLAVAYFAEGKLDTALEEVRLVLSISPDLPQGLNLRGLIHSQLGDDQLAEASFKRALEVAPRDADTMHNYGWFMCRRGRYAEADALYVKALATPQYRSSNRTMLVRGICEARAGNLEKAEATLKQAYEIDAANPATAMNLADVLYRRGDFERARFYVARVNGNTEQRNAESLWLAARIERRLGNAPGTASFGNQLRAAYPRSSEALALERGAFDE